MAVVATVTAWAASAVAAPLAAAETVPLPGNADGSQAFGLAASGCASAGYCAAGGFYTDNGLQQQGLLLAENGGSWAASELTLAAAAGTVSVRDPSVTSVACSSPGNCVAAGYYYDAANEQEGFLVGEVGGNWGQGFDATGASPSHLVAAPQLVPEVSCVSGGDCYAIFNTFDGSAYQDLVYAGGNGTWSAGHIPAPSGGSDILLSSISCPPGGPCAIVGSYEDAASDIQGLLATTGTQAVATVDTAALPSVAANPVVTPQAVSCAAAGACTAVGYYEDASGDYQGLLLSSTGGSWSRAVQAQLPGNAYAQGLDLSLNDVSCASAGNCEVVGTYDSGPTGALDGLLINQSGGQWGAASEIALPGAADSLQPGVYSTAVACPAVGGCLAGGVYQDASDTTQGLLSFQTATGWAPTQIAFPSGATDPSDASDVTSLACASSDYCLLAGGYHAGSSGAAFLVQPPGVPGSPSATAGVNRASVTWGAPSDNGGFSVTAYRIVANDLTNPARGGQVVNLGTSDANVALPTLTVGDRYTFSIAAINQLGIGPSKTSNAVAILPSAARLSASLAALLTPSGARGRLRAIHRAGGYTFSFASLEAGSAALSWFGHYVTGHGKHRRHHTTLIARVKKRIGTGPTRIAVRLNATGRRVLKTVKRLRVTSDLTFTVASQKPVSKTRTFTLH